MGGYTAGMDWKGESTLNSGPGRGGLDSLPGRRAKEVRAALSVLPREAALAGGELPLVLAAWSVADPEVAGRLLEEWLATADDDGNLSPACPLPAQLAGRVAEAQPDPERLLSRLLPGLARCVVREVDRYDARGTGLPLWPSAEEAWLPAEFAPNRFTVDLAVLLSNEVSAFCDLAEGREEFNRALDQAESEQRELDEWLKRNFWNEETALFYRYDEGRESIPDFSPCGFFPLVWGGRTVEMVEGVRPRTEDWKIADWPARAWILYFWLLLRTPHRSVMAQMIRMGLPAGASPVEAAAWTVLSAGAEVLPARPASSVLRWLDGHVRGIVRAAEAGGVVVLLGLMAWGYVHRESLNGTDFSQMERRARLACSEGRHDRAAALYGQAARRGQEAYFRYRQANEWMHLEQFGDAERAYRALLDREPDAPNVRLNLALSVWRQGRLEEALGLYRSFAEGTDTGAFPELAARARLAVDLIERQMELDRPAETVPVGSP